MEQLPTIAIVGIGGVFPGAEDLETFQENIMLARDSAREPPTGRWLLDLADVYDPSGPHPDKIYSRRACFLDDFEFNDSDLKADPQWLATLDPMYRLLLKAGRAAWRDGVTENLDRSRAGIVIGNIVLPTAGSAALADAIVGPLLERSITGRASSAEDKVNCLNRYVAGLPAGLLARALGLGGGSYTLDAACASSLYAIKYAVDELQAGRADLMLAGGLSRPDSLYTQMGFSALHAISRSGRCAPFDRKADGLVVGEGAGLVMLKRLEDALRDGDRIYATIAGIGLSNDIEGNLMSPASEGQLRAMRAAYATAGWRPGDVDLIECHGTGTPVGDAVEFNSLRTLWRDEPRERRCVIGSVKSNIGHLLTAAGAAGLIKTLLAMRAGRLPPTANFEAPGDNIDLEHCPFAVLTEAHAWERRDATTPRRAAVSAFGFGGINAHLLIEEWREAPAAYPRLQQQTEPPPPIAVVGMAACFGPWRDLAAIRWRVFDREMNSPTAQPVTGWGHDTGLRGFLIDKAEVPVGRFRIPPTELQDMLPQQLLMLQVAADALAAAGISVPGEESLPDAGVFIGIGLDLNTTNFHLRWSLLNRAREWRQNMGFVLDEREFQQWVAELRDACHPPLTANRTMGALGGIVASRIARAFRIGGPSFTVANEEASGLRALAMGVRALQRGEIRTAIVGAVDLAGDIRAVLAQANTRPFTNQTQCAPFDQEADGSLVGEGAAAFVLKTLADAERDGDVIHAVIAGLGAASGGTMETVVPPAPACGDAMRAACRDAGIEPVTIGHIEAHGSACPAEDAAEIAALADFLPSRYDRAPVSLGSAMADFGHCGAASGMAALTRAILCIEERQQPSLRRHRQPLPNLYECRDRLAPPAFLRPWLRNRAAGPRRALVNNLGSDGNCLSAVIAQHDESASFHLIGLRPGDPGLFSVNGADTTELLRGLAELADLNRDAGGINGGALAAHWWRSGRYRDGACSINLIASDPGELDALIGKARAAIETGRPGADPNLHYLPVPDANRGGLAFVFPGSGNHFPGMGRDAALRWPQILERLDHENEQLAAQFAGGGFWRDDAVDEPDCRDFIFGQVWLGTFMSDVIRQFGVEPEAIIGYSLGETAGLFATRTWTDRDLMLHRIQTSRLFTHELAGPCEAARRLWGVNADEAIQWQTGVVPVPADRLRVALQGRTRVYLLIVNTDSECVIGGERRAVQELAAALGCVFHPVEGVTSVHCEVAKSVAGEYRDLHLFPTTPPAGVRFYSGILGRAYPVDRDSAADSIVGQAIAPFDYTRVIRSAWDDGIRTFIELGPGATCTRMIGQVLNGRPHRALAVSARGQNEVLNILRALACLRAAGRTVDLAPLFPGAAAHELWEGHARISIATGKPGIRLPLPAVSAAATEPPAQGDPAIAQILAALRRVEEAKAESHAAFLKVANGITATLASAYALQRDLRGNSEVATTPGNAQGQFPAAPRTLEQRRDSLFDREQCLEFARGSIGRMLGEDFQAIDAHPTRVRLPDEPLMLVDRILTLAGEPRSLGSGRVVTEHDVSAGAWYLDHNRIPTCIAVEAGQADLFLSAWLGIDAETRGLAVYRLLDAEITLHGPLPQPGQTISYDIHIDHFFRQGETWLFRFYFDGTVAGKPLITMRNGCAGFFSPAELAAGRGIVLTSLEQQPQPGKRPSDWRQLAPMRRERYDDAQIAALRRGDLAGCFGESFASLPLHQPSGLPGGRMTLVHRVLDLDPEGGRYGLGLITGEADIRTDDWFLTCHFVDDRVMPGTLMYECCLHTLRVFLLRLGWVGEAADVAYEPIPGVSSRLKCRGQVIPGTRTVQYAITLKEYGYDATGTPYAIADALMSADGRPIVQMSDMSLRLSGLQRDRIEALWRTAPGESERVHTDSRTALFDHASIREFAIGKPSVAFGDRYRVFDDERVIARLPGPPFQFLDRIVAIEKCRPWGLRPGGEIVAEYDVPPEAWYFREARRPCMPFAVLLEAALQPCGWLAAYLGSALTSEGDLCFRNLGGGARQLLSIGPDAGTLATRIRITRASASGGMLIQNYDFEVSGPRGVVYQGDTYFGFFSREALANQVGLRDASLANIPAGSQGCDYPVDPPFPGPMLRMIDAIDHYDPKGGARGLGLIQGSVMVNPAAWFFKAHFHQDPVWPGSLGLESFLQLLEYAARDHWADAGPMQLTGSHQWTYRGQILPTDGKVTVQAEITALDRASRSLSADGLLSVDGRIIYRMQDFQLKLAP